jgi:hypothetical protein
MKNINGKPNLKENITIFKLRNVNDNDIELLREGIRGKTFLIANLVKQGKIIEVKKKSNLIANVGISVIAQRLTGDDTYSLEINYGALGTGTTPPTATDTTLETETYRFAVSSSAYDGNTAYIDYFINKGDGTGDYTEFGNFIDGTASTDSGVLFSKVAVDWEKTASDSLFISCEYTITSN